MGGVEGVDVTSSPDDGLLVDEVLILLHCSTLTAACDAPLHVRLASQIHLDTCSTSNDTHFCVLYFQRLASRLQHTSDVHSKFALRPHHVWKYGRHPIYAAAEIRRGRKE